MKYDGLLLLSNTYIELMFYALREIRTLALLQLLVFFEISNRAAQFIIHDQL
jgi:hypothetical protein